MILMLIPFALLTAVLAHVLLFAICIPSIWLHEVAHLMTARLFNMSVSKISFGDPTSSELFSFSLPFSGDNSQSLSVSVYADPFGGSVYGSFCRIGDETEEVWYLRSMSKRKMFWMAFAGPFANICLSVGCMLWSCMTTGHIESLLSLMASYNVYLVIRNLNPLVYNSDGKKLLMHIVGLDNVQPIVQIMQKYDRLLYHISWIPICVCMTRVWFRFLLFF